MKTMKLVLLLVLTVSLLVVGLQNTAPMHMRFFWLTGEAPAVLLLVVTAAGGFVLGLLVALIVRSGAKSPLK